MFCCCLNCLRLFVCSVVVFPIRVRVHPGAAFGLPHRHETRRSGDEVANPYPMLCWFLHWPCTCMQCMHYALVTARIEALRVHNNCPHMLGPCVSSRPPLQTIHGRGPSWVPGRLGRSNAVTMPPYLIYLWRADAGGRCHLLCRPPERQGENGSPTNTCTCVQMHSAANTYLCPDGMAMVMML